jgi:hypothetical protein
MRELKRTPSRSGDGEFKLIRRLLGSRDLYDELLVLPIKSLVHCNFVDGKQESLDLLIEPRGGLTQRLVPHSRVFADPLTISNDTGKARPIALASKYILA